MGFQLKSREELARMSGLELRIYRTQLWLLLNQELAEVQKAAWRPILRAVERSNANQAALVLKQGGLTTAIVTVEFFAEDSQRFDNAIVRLYVDRRNGKEPEQYAPEPEALLDYLARLGLDIRYLTQTARWEPV